MTITGSDEILRSESQQKNLLKEATGPDAAPMRNMRTESTETRHGQKGAYESCRAVAIQGESSCHEGQQETRAAEQNPNPTRLLASLDQNSKI